MSKELEAYKKELVGKVEQIIFKPKKVPVYDAGLYDSCVGYNKALDDVLKIIRDEDS